MNILFYMLPKAKVEFVYDDFTIRQLLEKMEFHRYSSIPLLNKEGKYLGTITEGDILWAIKNDYNLNLKSCENITISSISRHRDYLPVSINKDINDIITTSFDQNFVPIIDDRGYFIRMVTRKTIIQYCYEFCPKTNL